MYIWELFYSCQNICIFVHQNPEIYTALPHNAALSGRGEDLIFFLLQFSNTGIVLPPACDCTVKKGAADIQAHLSVTLLCPLFSMRLAMQHN